MYIQLQWQMYLKVQLGQSIHNYVVIISTYLNACTLFSFEAAPPSLHAMIGLCVVGCLSLDLTLLQTALLETNKIAGVFLFFISHAFCKAAGFMCVRYVIYRRR